MITQLSGRASEWGTAIWDAESLVCGDFREFASEMKRVFDRSKHEAACELLHMRQGCRSVSDFAIDFQTLAVSMGWGIEALFDTFLNGLSEELKDELASHDLPGSCEELIDLAIRIDTRLHQRHCTRAFGTPAGRLVRPVSPPPSPPSAMPAPEPIQVNRTRLTPEERQRRLSSRSCLYCDQPGHFVASCPAKANAHP